MCGLTMTMFALAFLFAHVALLLRCMVFRMSLNLVLGIVAVEVCLASVLDRKECSWIMVASLQPCNDARPNYTNNFCTVNLFPLFPFLVRMIFIALHIFLSSFLVEFFCIELFYLWCNKQIKF